MPNFTKDWFTHNLATWNTWLLPLAGTPIQALEVGSFEGRSALYLLEQVLTHPESHLTCIDTFAGSMESEAHHVDVTGCFDRFFVNTAPYHNRMTILTGESYAMLRNLSWPFNLIYLDGSHVAADVLTDIVLSWPLLAPGGILIMDDYDWDYYHDPLLAPKIAIDAFLKICKGSYELLEKGHQVIVKKL